MGNEYSLKNTNTHLMEDYQELLKKYEELKRKNDHILLEKNSLEETVSAMESILDFSRKEAMQMDKEIKVHEALLSFVQIENLERNKETTAFSNVLELSRMENIQRDSKLKEAHGIQQKSNEVIQMLMLQKNMSALLNSTLEISEIIGFLFDKLAKIFNFQKILFEEVEENKCIKKVGRIYFEGKSPNEIESLLAKEIDLTLNHENPPQKIMDFNSVEIFQETVCSNCFEPFDGNYVPIYQGQRIFIPVVSQNQVIAVIQASFLSDAEKISDKHKELLEGIISLITPAIKNAKLYQEILEKTNELENKNKMIAKDLKMAMKLQTNFISGDYKKINKLSFDIVYDPMIEVGGDIYDIVLMKPDYCRVFLADATGHGIQAALTTMIIKTEYDKIKQLDIQPVQVLEILNNEFFRNYFNLNVFFSGAVVDIDLKKNELIYASAGHPDQYLISSQSIEILQVGGKLLGVQENADFRQIKNCFQKNDKLILFTDGLFEEFSAKGELFGEERLLKLIERHKKESNHILIQAIMRELKGWIGKTPINDDISFIGIQRK